MTKYGFAVSRTYVSMQISAKSPIIIPFPGWWLLTYLAISCFSDHHHLNLLWIYSVACENGAPWRREAGCSCSLHCSLALCKLILAFSLYCPFYHWPDVSMKSLSPLQNASLLLWQCCLCTDSHVHLPARARCLSSLPQLPQHLSPPSISALSSSSSPPQGRELQAAAPKKTLGKPTHWQFVTGSSFQQGCLKNIPFCLLVIVVSRAMDTQYLCAVMAKSKNSQVPVQIPLRISEIWTKLENVLLLIKHRSWTPDELHSVDWNQVSQSGCRVQFTVPAFFPFPSPSSLQKHKVILNRGDRQWTERIWSPGPWQWPKQNLSVLTLRLFSLQLILKTALGALKYRITTTTGRILAAIEQEEVEFTSLWIESFNTQTQNIPIYLLTRHRIAQIVQSKKGKKEKQKPQVGLGKTFLYVQHQTEGLFGLLTRKSWYADLLGRLPWSQHIGEKKWTASSIAAAW